MKIADNGKVAIAIFMATAGVWGLSLLDVNINPSEYKTPASSESENLSPVVVADSNSDEYSLTKNDDGTETATYSNGEQVTFKNDSNGNVSYISGNETLLSLILMNYLLYSGFNNSGSYNNSTRSFVNSMPAPSTGIRSSVAISSPSASFTSTGSTWGIWHQCIR